MHKFTVADVARATGGDIWPNESDGGISAIATDSRTTQPGELYVALRGTRFDGHQFIPEALRAGAAAVLMEASALPEIQVALQAADIPAVLVSDTLDALQSLATWHRSRLKGPVVAITGSNGKTSTKDLVAAALGSRFPVHATQGNLNNEIGVPLTILQWEQEQRGLVVEMGMRARGEIRQLAQIAHPTIGVVTNVGPVHLETLIDLDGVAAAKAELVEQLPAHGIAVLNADDSRVAAMATQTSARVVTYGLDQRADIHARDIEILGLEGIQFNVKTSDGEAQIKIPLLGEHNVSNALAAIGVAQACGLTLKEIAHGLRNMRLSAMRMEVVPLAGEITLLNDAYNAAPASMRAALHTLRQLPGHRRAVVLGDMLELGERARQEHETLGRSVAEHGFDRLIVLGEWAEIVAAAAEGAGFPRHSITVCGDADEAAQALEKWVSPHDVVLVKASRGLRLERVVDYMVQRLGGSGESTATEPGQEGACAP